MLPAQLKSATTVLLTAGVLGLGAAGLFHPALAQRETGGAARGNAPQKTQAEELTQSQQDKEEQAQDALKAAEARFKEAEAQLRAARAGFERAKHAANAAKGAPLRQQLQSLDWLFLRATPTKVTVGVATGEKRGPGPGEPGDLFSLSLPVAKDAKVLIDGREGKADDLRTGMRVALRLAEDYPEVTRIEATSDVPAPDQVLKAIDADKKTIAVTVGGKVTLEGLPVDPAELEIDISGMEDVDLGLNDLKPGMRVSLHLAEKEGLIVVKRIQARK